MAVQNAGTLFQQGLMKLIFLGYKTETEVLPILFNDNPSKKAYEEWTGMVGPGVAEIKTKGADMEYKDLIVESPKRATIKTYGLGIRTPFEDIEDDQTGGLKRLAEAVGRSHKVAMEVSRADVFNGAFLTTMTGYDGLALCSTAHTLNTSLAFNPATTDLTALPSRSQTTWSNRLATDSDLGYSSLIDAITLLRRTVTREGDYSTLTPRYLLVPPELEFTAYEITKSVDHPETANRAVSSINRFGLQIVSSPYLIDTDAWFLIADRHDLQFFSRKPLTVKRRDAEGSWDQLVESIHRHGKGFHDPRGVVGTPGA